MSSLYQQYEDLLEEGAKATNSESRDKILRKIRELILVEGFPPETEVVIFVNILYNVINVFCFTIDN